jgi:hypothetical protein
MNRSLAPLLNLGLVDRSKQLGLAMLSTGITGDRDSLTLKTFFVVAPGFSAVFPLKVLTLAPSAWLTEMPYLSSLLISAIESITDPFWEA